jgi:adenosylmethionine-8-amino-7-oxononanoate aminotransferase
MNDLEYDRCHIWHPYAALGHPPPVRLVKSARGTELTLADGRTLTDAVSSWWCVAHGHNHPAIVEAIRRQSETLSHVMFGGFTHAPAIELAQALTALTPPGLDRVFFADSGSISVEVAAKMAVQYQHALGHPAKGKLLALKGGYHGDTCCAMALSDPDGMHTLFRPIMPQHYFADPYDFNTVIETVERHEDEIAAVICEPVFQAANAMRFYDTDFLRKLRAFCDAKGLLLIFDEIAAGFYRTGPLWAGAWVEVVPDIQCVGKALTGGHLTLAATVASAQVAETISGGTPSAFMHGPTYMANPLACAVAIASLDLFAAADYAESVRNIEARFKSALAPLAGQPNVADVRVLGAVAVVEMKRLPARADIERVIDEHGVWLRPFCDYVYAMPPLVSGMATIDRIAAAIADLAACPPGPPQDGDFHE